VRAIDADKLKEVLERNFGHTGGALVLTQLIDAQDTVHPEPHWIPVEQDTPTEDDDYWATFEAETGRFVDWASWYQGRWVVWIEGSPAPLSNVIAWCKPMEPYKGVTT